MMMMMATGNGPVKVGRWVVHTVLGKAVGQHISAVAGKCHHIRAHEHTFSASAWTFDLAPILHHHHHHHHFFVVAP